MGFKFERYSGLEESERNTALLQAIDEIISDVGKNQAIKWLYDVLTIIDNKTSHLLRANSMILAIHTLILGLLLAPRNGSASGWGLLLLLLLFIPVTGIARSLMVFRVEWPFLPWKLGLEGLPQNFAAELEALASACASRTIEQGRIRTITFAGIVGLGFSLVVVFVSMVCSIFSG